MPDATAILEIIASLASTLTLDEILAECTAKIAQITGADGCAISAWGRPNNSLTVLANYVTPDIPHSIDNAGAVYPLADFATSRQALRRHPPLVLTINDLTADTDQQTGRLFMEVSKNDC